MCRLRGGILQLSEISVIRDAMIGGGVNSWVGCEICSGKIGAVNPCNMKGMSKEQRLLNSRTVNAN